MQSKLQIKREQGVQAPCGARNALRDSRFVCLAILGFGLLQNAVCLGDCWAEYNAKMARESENYNRARADTEKNSLLRDKKKALDSLAQDHYATINVFTEERASCLKEAAAKEKQRQEAEEARKKLQEQLEKDRKETMEKERREAENIRRKLEEETRKEKAKEYERQEEARKAKQNLEDANANKKFQQQVLEDTAKGARVGLMGKDAVARVKGLGDLREHAAGFIAGPLNRDLERLLTKPSAEPLPSKNQNAGYNSSRPLGQIPSGFSSGNFEDSPGSSRNGSQSGVPKDLQALYSLANKDFQASKENGQSATTALQPLPRLPSTWFSAPKPPPIIKASPVKDLFAERPKVNSYASPPSYYQYSSPAYNPPTPQPYTPVLEMYSAPEPSYSLPLYETPPLQERHKEEPIFYEMSQPVSNDHLYHQ